MTTTNTIPDTWAVATHIAALRRHLPSLAQQYHIKALGVFGSYVRNEQTPTSDLDILVEFDETAHHGLLTLARIENLLSDRLGIQVDLVLSRGLRRSIGQRIRDEVVWL